MFKLWKLNPLAFTKVLPKRNEIIDNSKAEKLPELNTYKANEIANKLHPSYQVMTISDIKDEDSETKTFTLRKMDGSLPAYFSAGQYLSICVEINGKKYCRPYSISSSPRESLEGFYTITVRRSEGGLVSNYLNDNGKVGDVLVTSAPVGNFTYESLRDAKNVIGIVGGSGITPFRSFAKAINDNDEDFNLTILYGSRTLNDALFLEELKEIEKNCPKVKLVNVLSEENNDTCEHGFIDAEMIKKYTNNEEYSLFVCGPKAMYKFLENELPKLNLRKKFIRQEIFNPQILDDYVKPEKEEYDLTVRMNNKEYHIKANTNETLLVAMEKNDIHAPNDCRCGTCGWCHSQLISGEIYTPKANDHRRMADIEYGYIHPCVSYPLSDLVIDVPYGKY